MLRKDTGVLHLCLIFFSIPFILNGQYSSKDILYFQKSGAVLLESNSHLFEGKRIGIVSHASALSHGIWDDKLNRLDTGFQNPIHTVDRFIGNNWNVIKVFSPEHGFRSDAPAGEVISDAIDYKTGLPIISLYGKNKKPSVKDLEDLDILVFDLQDVGVRFYTYISTLSLVMEACAENGKGLIVLDRPNPFSSVVSGPTLDTSYSSFVGMHPVPVLYGLTIGEYAKMVKGQGWIQNSEILDLTVLTIPFFKREISVNPIPPSPNLPNLNSILLYPSLCLFEGCPVSVGRGTDYPFEVIGAPWYKDKTFVFTPKKNSGSKYPKFEKQICYGDDLRNSGKTSTGFNIDYILEYFETWSRLAPEVSKKSTNESFFSNFFDKLAGSDALRKQIEKGLNASEISQSWEKDLRDFKENIRDKYILYPVD
jgi:uncharacterized protein YbbC (DUF1343 family)